MHVALNHYRHMLLTLDLDKWQKLIEVAASVKDLQAKED